MVGEAGHWSRKGIFFLNIDFVRRAEWDVLAALFDGVVVIEARSNFATSKIEYWAMSEHFERVPEGRVLPEYECKITRLDDGAVVARWLKDGIEPEPPASKPIQIRTPDLRRINISVAEVIQKHGDASDLLVDVDVWINTRDWLNPAMATAARAAQ